MELRDSADYMAMIRYGEDLLTEIMQKVQDINLWTAKPAVIQPLAKRIQPLEEAIRILPGYFKRIKIAESLLNDLLESLGPEPSAEELIPLRSDPIGALPLSFEEEIRSSVTPELWKEYMDIKEKVCKRDAYIRTIIDTERAILQEINCITHP